MINNLPEYWTNVPWFAKVCFSFVALLITGVIGPWCTQWARGRPSATVSRERAVADQELVVRKAQEDAIKLYQDGARAAIERENATQVLLNEERRRHRAEIEALEANRDEGWDKGRGMEDIAHNYSHLYRGLAQRFAALLVLARQIVSGSIMPERAMALLDQIPPVEDLPVVPKLRDVKRKRPE